MDENKKCHAIIHGASASAAAIGAGLAQLPLSDTIPLTGIQIGMIISIAKVFDVSLTEGAAKGLLAGFAASAGGRGISQILVGWVPGFGNAINASTAAAITEAIGWSAVSHFENLRDEKIRDFNAGYKHGERDTKEKFKKILEKLKQNEMDNVLNVVIFKYIMTKDGFESYTKFNTTNEQISTLIKRIENEFPKDFTLNEIDEFFNDWKEFNKEKGKKYIFEILTKQIQALKWDYFDIEKYNDIIVYIDKVFSDMV